LPPVPVAMVMFSSRPMPMILRSVLLAGRIFTEQNQAPFPPNLRVSAVGRLPAKLSTLRAKSLRDEGQTAHFRAKLFVRAQGA
jgi:hypothetical protein